MTQTGQSQGKDVDLSRRFRFALQCLNCNERTNNLQEMRFHIFEQCPRGKPYLLLCGHCEYKTNSWPNFIHHINKLDMHQATPCKAWYEFREQTYPALQPSIQSRQSTSSTALSSSKRPSFRALPSEDILPLAAAAAGLEAPAAIGDVLTDVEPDTPPLPYLPPPPETPPLLREGALEMFEQQQTRRMLSSSSYMTTEPASLTQPALRMVRVSESQSVTTTSTDTFPLLRQALALPTYTASSQRNILSGTIRTIDSIGATLNILEPR